MTRPATKGPRSLMRTTTDRPLLVLVTWTKYSPSASVAGSVKAMVVAVGNGKIQEDGSLRKLEVKAGDKILFSKYSGNEIKIDGTDHLILREDDILAVLD